MVQEVSEAFQIEVTFGSNRIRVRLSYLANLGETKVAQVGKFIEFIVTSVGLEARVFSMACLLIFLFSKIQIIFTLLGSLCFREFALD